MLPRRRGQDHARITENSEGRRNHPNRVGRLTMSRLDDMLAALTTMTPAQLRDEWQRVHKAPAPRISPDLLARGIAWQLQERALGGLAPSAARELKRLAAASAAVADAARCGASDSGINAGPERQSPTRAPALAVPLTNAADLHPGTTLMRSWGDRSWSVLVTETGLVFEGRHYDWLSKIAREITAAHWSGPRFFGLRAASEKREKDRAKALAQDARAGRVGSRTKTAPCIAAGTPSHA
jgi:hypothetical protein